MPPEGEGPGPRSPCVASDEQDGKFERLHARQQALKSRCEAWWTFTCPVCGKVEAVVVALSADALTDHEIVSERLDCAHCDFRVHAAEPYLSQVLLEPQILKQTREILGAYR